MIKRKNTFAGLLAFCLVATTPLSAQQQNHTIQGSWKGTIHAPGGDLDLFFNIKAADGGITASLDVPAQYAKGIKATVARYEKDSLIIEFQLLMSRYQGIYHRDSSFISGEWEQNSFSTPLKLKPSAAQATVKHPQEPAKPYPYNEEEVSFQNTKDNVSLAGTLTWPKDRPAGPAVILISGSGPQNRDEELLGHKPFLVLADALTKRGIAVLRFDDRGVGKSTGMFSKATTADFSNDAEAAFNYLKTRKEVDPKKIGLAGHSEGGAIAPIVAARCKDVAFIVLLGGPGVKGSELLLLQAAAISKASGMDKAEINKKQQANKRIYELAIKNSPGAADSIAEILETLGIPEESARVETHKILTPWVRYFLALDPVDYLSKTKCPVLALNGKKDVQVPYKENLEGIERDLKLADNKQVTVKAYEGLNHLFQHCSSGLPGEYETIEETLSPEVLADIGNWILKINAR